MRQFISRIKRTSTLLAMVALAVGLVGPSVRAQEPTGDRVNAAAAQAATVPLSTAIPYQGQLNTSGAPANGAYDFQFKLFDAATAGAQVGSTLVKDNVNVANGLFATELDFGAPPFVGQARWLGIAVRPGASTNEADYVPLTPRRPLLAVPYALYSLASAGGSGGNPAYGAAAGAPANAIYAMADGKMGIGTTAPDARLQINGGPLWTTDAGGFQWSKALEIGNIDALEFNTLGETSFGIGSRNGPNGLYFMNVAGSGAAATVTYPMMINANNYVGIGTTAPDARLQINGGPLWTTDAGGFQWSKTLEIGNIDAIEFNTLGDERSFGIGSRNGPNGLYFMNVTGSGAAATVTYPMMINADNYVGIGTTAPQAPLEINNGPGWRAGWHKTMRIDQAGAIEFVSTTTSYGVGVSNNGTLSFFAASGNSNGAATGGMGLDKTGNFTVTGTTTTGVLKITGGDLAEPFEITGAATIQPGLVVAIDPDHPGQMRLANTAYDHTVAGVISGAGGIHAGVLMYKDGATPDSHPVALSGRVYVYADATNGAIEPGDLLTTSDTPGHAMKVTNHDRAQGAILGKAMSRLEEGTGLVLVLVTLQ